MTDRDADRVVSEEERALVLARRDGYMRALRDEQGIGPTDWMERRAREVYPLPTRKVPRVVKVDGRDYRVNAGRVEYRLSLYQTWVPSTMQPHAIEAVTALLANPFEEVEE